jgi:hypothetical protein
VGKDSKKRIDLILEQLFVLYFTFGPFKIFFQAPPLVGSWVALRFF